MDTMKDPDGNLWLPLFFNTEAMHKGETANIIMPVTILDVLKFGLEGENLKGVVIDPFDRPFTLSNPLVKEASKTISIYVYEKGINGQQYSLTTAVGLFQSVVCVIFLLMSNSLAKKFGERGIW